MKRVKSLDHLMQLANERRAIVSPNNPPLCKPKPAAFLLAWQGRMIYYALKRGVYVYERKSK